MASLFLKIKLATVDSKECSRGFANALTAYGTRDRRTDANKGINYYRNFFFSQFFRCPNSQNKKKKIFSFLGGTDGRRQIGWATRVTDSDFLFDLVVHCFSLWFYRTLQVDTLFRASSGTQLSE